jgi:hypothetical protein
MTTPDRVALELCKPRPRVALAPPAVVPASMIHHRPSRRSTRPIARGRADGLEFDQAT